MLLWAFLIALQKNKNKMRMLDIPPKITIYLTLNVKHQTQKTN